MNFSHLLWRHFSFPSAVSSRYCSFTSCISREMKERTRNCSLWLHVNIPLIQKHAILEGSICLIGRDTERHCPLSGFANEESLKPQD